MIKQLTKLGPIELEIIHLGIIKNGIFNESDLENSQLKRLGVGKILDILGELRERDLISIDSKGFSVTQKSQEYLWGSRIPAEIKILRLLRIKPYNLEEIAKFLLIDANLIDKELENLRKRGFVLMSPVWKESILEKTFEVLQDGLEYLENAESGKIINTESNSKNIQINELLLDIQRELEASEINPEKKRAIFEKIQKIRNTIE